MVRITNNLNAVQHFPLEADLWEDFLTIGYCSKTISYLQGVHSPEGTKFLDFSLTFPGYDWILMCVEDCLGSLGACSPIKFSKLGRSDWLKMNFTQQNCLTFPWLSLFLKKSLTFPWLSPWMEIPWHFQIFQVTGHPAIIVFLLFSRIFFGGKAVIPTRENPALDATTL